LFSLWTDLPRFFLRVGLQGSVWRYAILTVACLPQTVTGCSQAPSSTNHQLVPASAGKGMTVHRPVQCPVAGSHPSASFNGRHSVTLTWKASRGSNIVGYCLYRSTHKKVATNKPNTEFSCAGCEQVNVIPVASTGCVDDLVRDDSSYYYVATALDPNKGLSSASNEVRADIPSGPPNTASKASSYALCRDTSKSK